MKFRFLFTLMLAIGILFPTLVSAQDPPSSGDDFAVELVVELERDQDPTRQAKVFLTMLDIPTREFYTRISHTYEVAIVGFSVFLTEDEYAKARRLVLDDNSAIKSISESIEVTLPIVLDPSGVMPTTAVDSNRQVLPTGIERIAAAPVAGEDYSGVDVAVLDTGVDKLHPDLNVVGGIDCTVREGAFGEPGHDGFGHGTHVAGTIAAKDNGTGVVGVAPGARIIPVKVLNDAGYGSYATVLCGIDYVAKNTESIDVANMSLGGFGFKTECGGDDPMHNAICVASEETPFVVAAGNSTSDASGFSPANYPEVVTVSAFADYDGQAGGAGIMPFSGCAARSLDDELATFSNFGRDVDIAAPGTCILSTLPGEYIGEYSGSYPGAAPSTDKDSGQYTPMYGYASGTSMASPHVAGAIARYLAVNPDQSEFAIRQVITWSAANSDPIKGDTDSLDEPLLFVGSGFPRYEGANNQP